MGSITRFWFHESGSAQGQWPGGHAPSFWSSVEWCAPVESRQYSGLSALVKMATSGGVLSDCHFRKTAT